jgi:hypothetical protein
MAVLVMRTTSPLLRRKALHAGVLGGNWFWRAAAVYVFGSGIFGKHSERLSRYRLGPGHYVSVRTERPTTRRERKRLARAGTPVPTIAGRRRRAEAELARAVGRS